MDKNTLSNYGWIVIAVLVLSVMIALATPFGSYIEQGVRSTTQGLFDTSEKAMNVVGMTAGNGNFEDGYQTSAPKGLTTLTEKTWNINIEQGKNIWTDGTNTYYSNGSEHYVLNGDTWETKVWNGTTSFLVDDIWTDGTNVYCNGIYKLNNATNTWEWNYCNVLGLIGNQIWTDGTNTYYSTGSEQYVLNGDTWEHKTWTGLTSFSGGCVWTDGENYYYSEVDWSNVETLTIKNYVFS